MSKLTELLTEVRCRIQTLNEQQGMNVVQVVNALNDEYEDETFYQIRDQVYLKPEHDHCQPVRVATCY